MKLLFAYLIFWQTNVTMPNEGGELALIHRDTETGEQRTIDIVKWGASEQLEATNTHLPQSDIDNANREQVNSLKREHYTPEREVVNFDRGEYLTRPADPTSEPKKVLPQSEGVLTRTLKNKRYEITNHLGNVLTVVSDWKKGIDVPLFPDRRVLVNKPEPASPYDGIADYYTADVMAVYDYYGFGSQMPGRTFNAPEYRFGFNGQEKDGELKGEGNSYDFTFRIYDPRIGRFLSIDPLTFKFPFLTPYQISNNSPISNIDIEGKESLGVDVATYIGMWRAKLELATKDIVQSSSGNALYHNQNVPQGIQRKLEAQQFSQGMKVYGEASQEVIEGSIDLSGSIPGAETGSDIFSTLYYTKTQQYEKASVSAIAIFLPAISGSQIRKVGEFATQQKLFEHFKKHASEFGDRFKTAEEYLNAAQEFFKNVTEDVVQYIRKESGDIVQYNPKTKEFGVITKEGTIRTYFKPTEGDDYVKKQLKKELTEKTE